MAFRSLVDVNCSLCRQPYSDPRLLPCLHAFCFDCLQKLSDESNFQKATLPCPTCFEQTARPLQDLPKHVHLSNQANLVRRVSEFEADRECENCDSAEKALAFCHDCGDSGLRICKQCVEFHKKFRAFKGHVVVSLGSDIKDLARKASEKESVTCDKHNTEAILFFCLVCQAQACNQCILFDHYGHEYKSLKEVSDEKKTEIQSACSELKEALPCLAQSERTLKDAMVGVDSCSAEVKGEIEQAFETIIAAVQKRKHELLAEADTLAVSKNTRLTMQQEDLGKLSIAIKLTLDTIEHSIQLYTPVEFISIHKILKQSCFNLLKRFGKVSLTPVASPSMIVSISTVDVASVMSRIGFVKEKLLCSPSHSSLVGINTMFPIGIAKDARRTLILQTRNSRGEPMLDGQVDVRAWLTDQQGRKVCESEVSKSNEGKYDVTFCAGEEGLWKAHITTNGCHIDGSPCDVIVRDYAKLQEPVLSFETPSRPTYLCTSHRNGDIFVTLNNGDIHVYSEAGVLKSVFSGATLDISSAHSIVLDEEREIMYVACSNNNKVVKATLDGKLLSSVGSLGADPLQFSWPMALCCDQSTSGNIYVADQNNTRIQVLGPDLTFKKELKCHDSTRGMAMDSLGNVHVATASGVKVLNTELNYSNGRSCGDIVISPDDYRFVSCIYSGCSLEILKPDNSLLATIQGLRYPLGLCLNQSGYIFVAEYEANKVHKY